MRPSPKSRRLAGADMGTPRSSRTTFRDLLSFEERLKQNHERLKTQRRIYEAFLTLLVLFILFTGYRVFIKPSIYSLVHYSDITLLLVSLTTLILFFGTGMYYEKIVLAYKFTPQANRSLRPFNMYLNTRTRSFFALVVSRLRGRTETYESYTYPSSSPSYAPLKSRSSSRSSSISSISTLRLDTSLASSTENLAKSPKASPVLSAARLAHAPDMATLGGAGDVEDAHAGTQPETSLTTPPLLAVDVPEDIKPTLTSLTEVARHTRSHSQNTDTETSPQKANLSSQNTDTFSRPTATRTAPPAIPIVARAPSTTRDAPRAPTERHIPPTLNPRGEIIFSSKVNPQFREGYERYRADYERKRLEAATKQKWFGRWQSWLYGGAYTVKQEPRSGPRSGSPGHKREIEASDSGAQPTDPITTDHGEALSSAPSEKENPISHKKSSSSISSFSSEQSDSYSI